MKELNNMINHNYSWNLESDTNSIWAYQSQVFSAQDCERIIDLGKKIPPVPAHLGQDRHVNAEIRQGTIAFFDSANQEHQWIFHRVTGLAKAINQQFWNFDLKFMESLQFTCYENHNDFYTSHMDMSYTPLFQRKLSVSVQLSDAASYVGCDLELFRCGLDHDPTPRAQGTIVVFPSYHVHRVTPIITGTRYSLVSWLLGPPFK